MRNEQNNFFQDFLRISYFIIKSILSRYDNANGKLDQFLSYWMSKLIKFTSFVRQIRRFSERPKKNEQKNHRIHCKKCFNF